MWTIYATITHAQIITYILHSCIFAHIHSNIDICASCANAYVWLCISNKGEGEEDLVYFNKGIVTTKKDE